MSRPVFFFRVHVHTYAKMRRAGLVRKLIALLHLVLIPLYRLNPVDANFLLFLALSSRFFFFLTLASLSISLNLSRYDPLLYCPSLFKLRSQSPPRLPRELSELSCHARRCHIQTHIYRYAMNEQGPV